MPKAFDQDLRDRVIDAVVLRGMSCRAAAKLYDISASTAVKWVQAYHREGRRTVTGRRGRPPSKVLAEQDWIIQAIEHTPDITLHLLAETLFEARGLRLHPATLSRFLKRERISFKKNAICRRAGQA